MGRWPNLFVLLLACVAAPAAACPPPIPGQTETERLKPGFDAATDIVYGVVLKGARDGQKASFKILHVYKGALTPGAIVRAKPSYGFDPPPCLGMIQAAAPRVAKGEYGVVALGHDRAFLNFVDPNALNLAFREGWISSARR
jgi:hypothetical protein